MTCRDKIRQWRDLSPRVGGESQTGLKKLRDPTLSEMERLGVKERTGRVVDGSG